MTTVKEKLGPRELTADGYYVYKYLVSRTLVDGTIKDYIQTQRTKKSTRPKSDGPAIKNANRQIKKIVKTLSLKEKQQLLDYLAKK